MNTKTKSEELFEIWCAACGIPCRLIKRSSVEGEKTADFEIRLGEKRVIAEVKQFDPNEEEMAAEAALDRGESALVNLSPPGRRIRKAIGRARKQLKAMSRGEYPTMVVVYNNTSCSKHTFPEAVAFAMHGLDVLDVEVPQDPAQPLRFGEFRSGPMQSMSRKQNTSISAVCVLRDHEQVTLDVYENDFALHPINPGWHRHPLLRYFRRPPESKSSMSGWEEL